MTESTEPTASGAADRPLAGTAGSMLFAAREAAGLHIGALAVALKVPVAKLESLEADRHAELPDAVFIRALAGSVCKVLKIEPGPVLALLPGAPASVLVPDRLRTHGAYRPSGERSQMPLFNRVQTPMAVAVGVLLVATFALLFWPKSVVQPAENLPVLMSPLGGSSQPTTAPVAPANPMAASAAVAPAHAATDAGTVVTSVAPAPGASAALAVPVKSASAAALPGVVEFKARAASWIEVTDARGAPAIRRTLSAGETVVVGGPLPLSIVVGRADVTQVQVRGQAFDLAPVSRDNVARFQVK